MTSSNVNKPAVSTTEETPSISTPHTNKDTNKPNSNSNNRKRFGNQNHSGPNKKNRSDGKRSEANFEKKSDSTVLSVFTLLPVFELFTSFYGVQSVSTVFFNILQARDSKMTNLFSVDDLTYTMLLCVYYRCASVINHSCTKIVTGLSELKSVAEGVYLPDVLAQFVESFGQVKLSNGIIIIPMFDSFQKMRRHPGFVDPAIILQRMELDPTYHEWSVCTLPVLRYMQASSRALKNAMELRPVRYSELEGRPELLGCYSVSDNEDYQVTALDKIDQHQAQLGAACRYRTSNFGGLEMGLAIPPCFGANNMNPDMVLTRHILSALKG